MEEPKNSYINPIDTNQLRATINELLNTDGAQLEAQNAQLKDHIINHYSWDTVGTLSLAAYESLLR